MIMCIYCFFIIQILQYLLYKTGSLDDDFSQSFLNSFSSPNASEIVNWVCYTLLLILTFWSFYQIVFTPPGYVPRTYHYKLENMGQTDRYVFEKLKMAIHSTARQLLEGNDSEIRGSYVKTGGHTSTSTKEDLLGGGGRKL